MKTKSKRLLSLALAVVMAVSASMACFSAYAYKPEYGEQATECQFTAMIGDLTQLLDDNLITGDVIESLYEALPSLSAVLSKGDITSADGEYYLHDGEYTYTESIGGGGGVDVEEREFYTVSASGDGMYSDWYFGSITGSLQLAKDGSLDLYIYYYTTIISEGITFNHIYANGVEITETSEYSSGVMQGVQFTIYGADYDDDVVITVDYTVNGAEEDPEPEPEPDPDDGEDETASIALSVSYDDGGTGLAEPSLSLTTFTGESDVYLVFQPWDSSYDNYTVKVSVDLLGMGISSYYYTITEGTLASLDVSGYAALNMGFYQIPITGNSVTGSDYIANMIGTSNSVTVYVEISAPTNSLSSVALLSETEDDVDTVEEDTTVDEDAEDVTEDVAEDTDAELDVVSFFADNDFLSYCNEDGTIADDTFANFFADHPITVESETEFAEWLKATIENYIIVNGITSIIQFVAPGTAEEVETSELVALFESVDMICEALGIEQEVSLADAFGIKYAANGHNLSYDEINAYIANIIDAIFADDDAVNNIIDILQVALTDANFSLLYDGIVGVLDNIDAVLSSLSSFISDLDSVLSTINQISSILKDLPKVEGNDSLIDVNALIPYILTMDSIAETIGDYVTVNDDGTIQVTLAFSGITIIDAAFTIPEIDLSLITEAESNADVLKVVVDWVYELVQTNYDDIETILTKVGALVGSLDELLTGVGLSEELTAIIVGFVDAFMYGTNDDAAWYVITLVASLTERDVNDVVCGEGEDEGSTGSDTGSGSTGSGDDATGDTTGDSSSDTTGDTSDTSDTSDASDSSDDDTTTSTVSSTSIPDTGRVDEGVATAALIVFVCAAAALVIVLVKTRKKVSE